LYNKHNTAKHGGGGRATTTTTNNNNNNKTKQPRAAGERRRGKRWRQRRSQAWREVGEHQGYESSEYARWKPARDCRATTTTTTNNNNKTKQTASCRRATPRQKMAAKMGGKDGGKGDRKRGEKVGRIRVESREYAIIRNTLRDYVIITRGAHHPY
jgi:hypothetical protein